MACRVHFVADKLIIVRLWNTLLHKVPARVKFSISGTVAILPALKGSNRYKIIMSTWNFLITFMVAKSMQNYNGMIIMICIMR